MNGADGKAFDRWASVFRFGITETCRKGARGFVENEFNWLSSRGKKAFGFLNACIRSVEYQILKYFTF